MRNEALVLIGVLGLALIFSASATACDYRIEQTKREAIKAGMCIGAGPSASSYWVPCAQVEPKK